MDFIDRLQLFLRFSLLAVVGLFGDVNGTIFTNQLRKVEILIDNEFDEEIQSSEQTACHVAEETFECVGDNQIDGPPRTGESPEEGESSRVDGGESDECTSKNK